MLLHPTARPVPLRTLRGVLGDGADAVRERLGLLMLQAAVAAGLRIRDGNLYEPDPSLIPRDVRAVHRELRLRWRQERALARAVASWARDEGHPELRFTAETGELNGWSDPLPLARLAVALRPGDPLGRITLSMALLWWRRTEEAQQQLVPETVLWQHVTTHVRARWLWNQAMLLDCAGDPAAAAALTATCLRMAPGNRSYERDYLAYSVTSCMESEGVRALRRLREWCGAERARSAFLGVWQRERAPAGRLLRREAQLTMALVRVLGMSSPGKRGR